MNYFPFYACPIRSAQALDDKRLTRVFSESVFVLSWVQTLQHSLGPHGGVNPRCPAQLLEWITDPQNTSWYVRWVAAMREELVHRFGYTHTARYSSTQHWRALAAPYRLRAERAPHTFLNAARSKAKGLDYTHITDVHAAYRLYMAYQWAHVDKRPCVWTCRSKPAFAS